MHVYTCIYVPVNICTLPHGFRDTVYGIQAPSRHVECRLLQNQYTVPTLEPHTVPAPWYRYPTAG